MKDILKYISAKHFFPTYCKEVGNYTHKMRGKDGHGNPIEFTDQDIKKISEGLATMGKDLSKKSKN